MASLLTDEVRADIYGFKIIEDTREQNPLDFAAVTDIPAVVQTLKTGDYSATGYEHLITIERKSADDLVNTVIHDRARFECELQRMRDTFTRAVIFCEATWADISNHAYRGFSNPASVLGSIDAWAARYGVQTLFCSHPWYCANAANEIQLRTARLESERLNRIEMATRVANIVKYFVREHVGRCEWDRRMRRLKRAEDAARSAVLDF